MEGSGRTHCNPLHPRCRHLRRQHFNVQLSYDSLTAAGYVSEPQTVCFPGSGWRRGGPLDTDALPRARGLPGGARECLGLPEAGPLVGGEGVCGHLGAHMLRPSQGPRQPSVCELQGRRRDLQGDRPAWRRQAVPGLWEGVGGVPGPLDLVTCGQSHPAAGLREN